MPRIRTIKPEFWQDEKLSALDPLTRLVFLGLISIADDAGRILDNVKFIDGQLFPNTDDTSRDALEILERLSRISRYEVGSGKRIIQITNWQKHQRVDHPSQLVLPGPDEAVPGQPDAGHGLARPVDGDSREPRETLATDSRLDLGSRTLDLGSSSRASRRGGKKRDGVKSDFNLAPYIDVHREFFPGSTPPAGRYGKVFKSLEQEHGRDETLRRWRNCLALKQTFATPEELSTHWSAYEHEPPRAPAAATRRPAVTELEVFE